MGKQTKENKCDLCEKDRKNFVGLVWYYSKWSETNLCRSCYLKWCKSKECKSLEEKYKEAKPCTKLWTKMCKEQQTAFNKWFKLNSEVRNSSQA